MTHELVKKHLVLDEDGKCTILGHTLIPRACVHCGMTIHEISDANDHLLPLRESPSEIAERREMIEIELKRLKERTEEFEKMLHKYG